MITVEKDSNHFVFTSQHTLAEEEKLAKQQAITLEANYKKYEMTEQIQKDGSIARLASHYGINMAFND